MLLIPFYGFILLLFLVWEKDSFLNQPWVLWQLVIDRYWFFITDTDYLYVYVPITDIQNRYLFTVIK